MPDAAALSAFAGFVLAVLPRLLLYPGGLCAVLAVALPAGLRRRADREPHLLPEGQALAALALAWSGVALLPLPGAPPLPGGPDLLGPLALLLAASLLLLGPSDHDAAWEREMAGRPLLVATPLLVLSALGAPGLVLPGEAHLRGWAAAVTLLLAGSAYLLGLMRCYGPGGPAPWVIAGPAPLPAAAWLTWLGWVALVPAVTWSAVGAPALPAGGGPLLLVLAAAAAAGLLRSRAARAAAPRAGIWGWWALGAALFGVLATGGAG